MKRPVRQTLPALPGGPSASRFGPAPAGGRAARPGPCFAARRSTGTGTPGPRRCRGRRRISLPRRGSLPFFREETEGLGGGGSKAEGLPILH